MSTGIQWTDETINPIAAFDKETGKRGWFCVHASTGCVHCYAESWNAFRGNKQAYRLPNADKVEIRVLDHVLIQPERWRRPKKIFVCSMTDLFLDLHTDQMIDRVFLMMARNRRHTFQVLTKRAERMRDYSLGLAALTPHQRWLRMVRSEYGGQVESPYAMLDWPLPNAWLGVSVENQKYAEERIPLLQQTPAAVRWLSGEPLLESLQIPEFLPNPLWNNLASWREPAIHWIVIGGESGKGARPFHIDWARSLVKQCRTAGVAPFVKQLGADPRVGDDAAPLNLRDSHGGDWEEWPDDLRIREFPTADVGAPA